MYRIFSIFLLIAIGAVFVGCTPKADSSNTKPDSQILTGAWQVEDIDQGGVIDFAMVYFQIENGNRIIGSTGCNRFFGEVTASNGRFAASQVASTLRACPPAIAKQEQRFLIALNEAVRYEIKENTWLILYDATDKPRLKLIQMDTQSESSNTEMEQSVKKN